MLAIFDVQLINYILLFNYFTLAYRMEEPHAAIQLAATQPVRGQGHGHGAAAPTQGEVGGAGRGAPAPTPAPASPPRSQEGEEVECAICLSTDISRESRHILLPCKHSKLHSTCVHMLLARQRENNRSCPVCRAKVRKDMKYTHWVQEQLALIEGSVF